MANKQQIEQMTEESRALAALLFPEVRETPEDMEKRFPPRDLPADAMVTRLGPSPTGFIHLGNLFGALADERMAHGSGGVFFLRIEDTDDKRYVEGAVEKIIDSLRFFSIRFDEGAAADGKEIGAYGSYVQSKRGDIYAVYAKELVLRGLAYPCFLTEEEIDHIRTEQEKAKETPGIYGAYAKYRAVTAAECKKHIENGESYVIRLKSAGTPFSSLEEGKEETEKDSAPAVRRIRVKDGIRGELEMPENFQDVILLKTTGIPTYHFAHVVDDHLMRTTHVVRGAEWLSSLPIHEELFRVLGFAMPVYCHTAQLMKIGEDGNRRKLSKRKDPELSLDFYREAGYHPQAVREYLMTILNSNYEEWRLENPETPLEDFPFSTEKMGVSGALFDLQKLDDISKDVLYRLEPEELYAFLLEWARTYRPALVPLYEDKEYLLQILSIGRTDAKPRKDFIHASQIADFISYFFDSLYKREDEYPAEVPETDRPEILRSYLATYDHEDDNKAWFDKIRTLAVSLGYAAKPKEYKKNPDAYKGHVGHVSTVIRIALMGRSVSPDVWTIQQILGEAHTKRRIEEECARLQAELRIVDR